MEVKSSSLGDWFRVVVVVPVNQGYGYGLWVGLKTTQAPYVGWSHADQQCDPNDAFVAYELLKRESSTLHFVKGARSGRNWQNQLLSSSFERLARILLKLPFREINAQPKVFKRALLNEIKFPPSSFGFDLYFLFRVAKAGYNSQTIPVIFHPRPHGVSNWASSYVSKYKTILGMVRYIWLLRNSEGPI